MILSILNACVFNMKTLKILGSSYFVASKFDLKFVMVDVQSLVGLR